MVTPSTPNPNEAELQNAAHVEAATPLRDPPWGTLEALALVPGFLALTLLLSVIFVVPIVIWMVAHGSLSPGENPPLVIFVRAALPAQALAYVLVIAGVKLVLQKRGSRELLKAVHWNWPAWSSVIGISILGIAVALIASKLSVNMQVPPDAPIFEMLKDKVVAGMFVVFGIGIAPFAEEFYFRGLLYPALRRSVRPLAAVLITSAFFALIHASQVANSPGPVLVLFIVGLLLTVIRARTDSLSASVVFHVMYNTTLFVAGGLS